MRYHTPRAYSLALAILPWVILLGSLCGLSHMLGNSWRTIALHPWHSLVYDTLAAIKAVLG